MLARFATVTALAVATLALAACSGNSSAVTSGSSTPSATATTTSPEPSGWECFNVGIYDTALCRLPGDQLALTGVGDVILATQEKAYPSCPESWARNDDGRLCMPPSGWEADVQNGASTLSSSNGVQVSIGSQPVNVLPEKCDPVYVFGLVMGGNKTTAEWCIKLGDRYTHISVPAGLLEPDYDEAFQVALAAGRQ